MKKEAYAVQPEALPTVPAPVAMAERQEKGGMTIGMFVDALTRLLSPALIDSEFAINGQMVSEIDGLNIDIRNERIFVNLRTDPCTES